MALGLLADNNVALHVEAVLAVCRGRAWNVLWTAMGIQLHTFESLRLPPSTADSDLWHLCQGQEILLITANRNRRGADSLEATIRDYGTVTSLPMLTLADADRVLRDKVYAALVAERLIDVCLDVDQVRGTGRLYLPATGG